MRAAVVTEFGEPSVIRIQEWPDPVPAEGQVLVEVEVADMIFVDAAIRRGHHGGYFDVTPPFVPGSRFGGRVRATGPGVSDTWIGKTVVGRSVDFAAHAELVVAASDSLTETDLNLETAVAVTGDGFTTLLLEQLAPDLQGKDVLITASAGGMGLLLIQLAHRAGARVIAAARGQAKLDLSQAQGADVVIDYSQPGWEKSVLEATGGRGADVVFEGAGGELGTTAFGVVKDGGWFSAHGAPSGTFATYDPAEADRRGITVKGIEDLRVDLVATTVTDAAVLQRAAAGDLVPVVDRVFDLDHVAEAHTALEQRVLLGKALIRVRPAGLRGQ
ncbi:alanine dehydrogenase [Kribbella antibiotica]|uniref:Alanine dehydrogenase n=1 Tax=Kribbella antibiotica TaxID=190195 RepID=A0A4R4ZKQ0_9ACTN|nr:zinc-binding dehydrogenase [Kribbella antibiotica]TDD59303.1 alanine dehydrogenase [Kribbella antibiotica]